MHSKLSCENDIYMQYAKNGENVMWHMASSHVLNVSYNIIFIFSQNEPVDNLPGINVISMDTV